MLHRSVMLTSLLVAIGLVPSLAAVHASTLTPQSEQPFNVTAQLAAQLNEQPLVVPPNSVKTPVNVDTSPISPSPLVVPSNLEPEPPLLEKPSLQTPTQTEILPASTVQPVPSDSLEFELPSSGNTTPKPLYSDEQPLRLEIKLSRRRVTLYRGTTPVKTYAIAVGRPGWETPTGTYKVQQMFKNPTWVHPLQKGISIPGGDPENPLGRYWIGFWTDGKNWIGFHGTPNPGSVGTAASHGCIRMYNKDIEELFQKVSLGVEVKVIR